MAALFPEAAAGLSMDDWLTRQIAAALGRVAQGPVMPSVDMPRFRRELAALDFATPRWPPAGFWTGPSDSLRWERCT